MIILLCGLALAADPWSSALQALGPGILPELPIADPKGLERATASLTASGGWQASAIGALTALRFGDYRTAADLLGGGLERCGEATDCQVFLLGIAWFAMIDQHSSADRALLLSAIHSRSPESVAQIDEWGDQVARLARLLPEEEKRPMGWLLAGGSAREGRSMVASAGLLLPPPQRVDLVTGLRQRVPGDDEIADWLRWSIDSIEPPPTFADPSLQQAAALWHADALAAPVGGVSGADFSAITSPGRWTRFAGLEVEPPDREDWRGRPAEARAALDGLNLVRDPHAGAVFAWSLLQDGDLAGAERALKRAAASVSDLRSYNALIGAAVVLAIRRGEIDDALTGLQALVDQAEQHDAYGIQSATLASWAGLVPEVTRVAGPGEAARFGLAGLRAALGRDQVDRLPIIASATLDPLQIPGFEVDRIKLIDEVIPATEDLMDRRTALARGLPEGDPLGEILARSDDLAGLLCLLTTSRLDAMSRLSMGRAELEPWRARIASSCALAGMDPATIQVVLLTAEVQHRLASGDDMGALDAARRADNAPLVAVLSVARGERDGLRAYAATLGAAPPEPPLPPAPRGLADLLDWTSEHQRAEAERHKREVVREPGQRLALQLAAMAGDPELARQVHEEWLTGPDALILRASLPWLEEAMGAARAEAEGRGAEARAAYAHLISTQRPTLPGGGEAQVLARAEEGWLRLADLAPAASVDELDRMVDRRRWEDLRVSAGDSPSALAPELLPSWRSALPEGGLLLGLAMGGRSRSLLAWVEDEAGEVARARFDFPVDALRPAWTIRRVSANEGQSDAVDALTAWIGAHIPAGVPLLIAGDGALRYAGLHALTVEGQLLAIRNPIAWTPTLVDFAQAAARRDRGRGTRIFGRPIPAGNDPRELVPVEDEALLARLGGTLLWGDAATRESLLRSLRRDAVVHISTHGVLDRLHPEHNGLQLANGETLGPADLADLRLPGSLVVLSACRGGYQARSYEAAPVLDLSLLRHGARAVVSTPIEVDAEVASVWMPAFHEALAKGEPPAWAASLATAATAIAMPDEPPRQLAAFSVLGAGW